MRINKMTPPMTPPTIGPTWFEDRTDALEGLPSDKPVPLASDPEDDEDDGDRRGAWDSDCAMVSCAVFDEAELGACDDGEEADEGLDDGRVPCVTADGLA